MGNWSHGKYFEKFGSNWRSLEAILWFDLGVQAGRRHTVGAKFTLQRATGHQADPRGHILQAVVQLSSAATRGKKCAIVGLLGAATHTTDPRGQFLQAAAPKSPL